MVVKNNHALVTNEQIHWNQLFFEMYGLAVVLTIPKLTTSKNIDEIFHKNIMDAPFSACLFQVFSWQICII